MSGSLPGPEHGPVVLPSFGDHHDLVFPLTHPISLSSDALVRLIHSYCDKTTSLAGTSDLLRSENQSIEDIPATVSIGWGESTQFGFDCIMYYMCEIIPTRYRLLPITISSTSSTFIDIGSGYGRPTLHAAARSNAKCVGIEYLQYRHQQALEIKQHLLAQYGHHSSSESLANVLFLRGDFTQYVPLIHTASHVYSFNRVFSQASIPQFVSILSTSPNLLMLVCNTPPSYFQESDAPLSLIHQFPAALAKGKQHFTFYIYIRTLSSSQLDTPLSHNHITSTSDSICMSSARDLPHVQTLPAGTLPEDSRPETSTISEYHDFCYMTHTHTQLTHCMIHASQSYFN